MARFDHAPDYVSPRLPAYGLLMPFPAVTFILTLVTDIIYWRTGELMWQHFSEWLLLAGCIVGGVAILVGLIEFLFRFERRMAGGAWAYLIGGVIVLLLAIVNSFAHAQDGWTGVVPYGLALSAATVLAIIVTAFWGRAMISRRGFGGHRHA